MRVIIAGSRHFKSQQYYGILVDAVKESGFNITNVICGMADGMDTWGKAWAKVHEVPCYEYPANWDIHGKLAGPIRNQKMAENADALILIWDGKSRGSNDMLNRAKRKNLHIFSKIC